MSSFGRVWGLLQKKLGFGKFSCHRKELSHKRIPLLLELLEDRLVPSNQPVTSNLVLWLNADQGVSTSGSSVTGWTDQSGNSHNGTVQGSGLTLVTNALNGNNAINFSGGGDLALTGQVLSSQQYTILALVTDTDTDTNFHEVFSNWSPTNAGTSIFLGTTNQNPVQARFTDYMGGAEDPNHNQTGVGPISSPTVPFVLGGLSTSSDASIYQNQIQIADNGAAIPSRGLTSQYFVGDQGSGNGEFWQGNIYEMLVYNGALTPQQMQQDWAYFQAKYFQPAITSLAAPAVIENGPSFTLTVNGTNFDPGATVQWNGTPLTVTSRTGSTQIQVTVPASLITEEGAYNITVTNPEMNGTLSAPSPFVVADAPLANVANVAFSATEGIPFSGTVATFTDTDPGSAGDPTADPSEYSATITWGDGSTSPGTVVYTGTPGNFTVDASGIPHTYAEDGIQASDFFVTIDHGTLAPVSTPAITVTVADAPVTATATPVTTAVYGVAFSGEVATFIDANPAAPASDFPLSNVTIYWGDGSTSTATAITQPGGIGTSFHLFGSHTYEKAGATAQPLQVTITDVGGSVSNTTSYTPTVSPYAFSYTIHKDRQTYGSPANLAADLPATISTGINGDNLDIAYSSSGDTSSADVASYDITGSLSDGTGLLSNYSVTLIDGSLAVTQADAHITVTGYSGVYDGIAHGATGSATGVNGENLNSLLHLGASFTNVPGGTANWTFAGNTDYQSASGSVAITIGQANATIKVSGYSGVYDGNTHGATGSATGVKGGNLSSLLHLGASFTDAPGGTAHWTFAGNTDYQSASGSVAIVISQAKAIITVNGYTGVYDGNAHGATGSATGIKGENLSSLLHLGASFSDVPGGTANWTFAGNTDYRSASGSVAIIISQANAAINVSGYTGVYDGKAHGAIGAATGVKGVNLNSLLNLGPTYVNAGSYTVSWSFAGNHDYNSARGTARIVITPAALPIAVISDLMLFGSVPPLMGTVNGKSFTGHMTFKTAQGDTLTVTLSSSVTWHSWIGSYPITARVTGAAAANYLPVAAGTMQVVWIGQDPTSSGPRSTDFWDNKHNAGLITQADLHAVDRLRLVNADGSAFVPTTAAQLQGWMQGANVKNAAYALSVQLATMELNMLSGYVNTSDMVLAANLLPYVGTSYSVAGLDGAGFISVGNLITLVNNALVQYPTASGGSAARGYLLDLTLALGATNDNLSFARYSL